MKAAGFFLAASTAVTLLSWPAVATPANEPIVPLPATLNINPARAEIGRQLFHDSRLSANGRVSCASCHDIAKGGADKGRRYSLGLHGVATTVNTPSVLNAALNFRQFWDGRTDSLEGQIEEVIQNPKEMGSRWENVVQLVSRDPKYSSAFAATYPEGVTKKSIQNAIASYERTLITPESRFDKYLRGKSGAVTTKEQLGYMMFKRYGCVACHQGKNIGGNMFQKFGVMADYFAHRGKPTDADLGRIVVTGKAEDKHVFKVPSLRNVELTAPYFHDGSAATLEEAVDVMFRYQLGRIAAPEDKGAIVAFLKSLTAQPGTKP